jgi:hypothetical protein
MFDNRIVEAAAEIQAFLQQADFQFCFIGGLAVQRWGQPRHTHDADLTVLTRFDLDEVLVAKVLGTFRGRLPDTDSFALQNRVLLIHASNGIPLDLGLGALDFEVRSVERSTMWQASAMIDLLTCSAEDLIVHKAFASRDLDWGDIDRIVMRQGSKLHIPQIFSELRPLVHLKEDSQIIPRLEKMLRNRGILPDHPTS